MIRQKYEEPAPFLFIHKRYLPLHCSGQAILPQTLRLNLLFGFGQDASVPFPVILVGVYSHVIINKAGILSHYVLTVPRPSEALISKARAFGYFPDMKYLPLSASMSLAQQVLFTFEAT